MTQLDLDGLKAKDALDAYEVPPRGKIGFSFGPAGIMVHVDPVRAAKLHGKQLKATGIARTLAAEHDAWLNHTIAVLGQYARSKGKPFSMAEFRDAWDDLGYTQPHHPNCWSAVMAAAARQKLVKPTSEWVESKRPAAHRRWVRLWEAA